MDGCKIVEDACVQPPLDSHPQSPVIITTHSFPEVPSPFQGCFEELHIQRPVEGAQVAQGSIQPDVELGTLRTISYAKGYGW